MKYTITLLLLLLAGSITAQVPEGLSEKTKIYLVRHAEKQTGTDPALTPDGNKRAGDLLRVLRKEKIHRIYASQYKRTQMTGDSLRLQMGIDTVLYTADAAGDDVYKKVTTNKEAGKTILIIGHSNTIPKIIQRLGVLDFNTRDIPDGEFDNLYLVTYKKGKASVKLVKYGAASAASAAMQ